MKSWPLMMKSEGAWIGPTMQRSQLDFLLFFDSNYHADFWMR
jgi:hypothetical protein